MSRNSKRTTIPKEPVEPYAEVKRVGRITFNVSIVDPTDGRWGSVRNGRFWGRKRAEQKAARELRRYLRRRGYGLEPRIVLTGVTS